MSVQANVWKHLPVSESHAVQTAALYGVVAVPHVPRSALKPVEALTPDFLAGLEDMAKRATARHFPPLGSVAGDPIKRPAPLYAKKPPSGAKLVPPAGTPSSAFTPGTPSFGSSKSTDSR